MKIPPSTSAAHSAIAPANDTFRELPWIDASSSPRASLTVLTGRDAGRLVPIAGHGLVVGRSKDADLVVSEGDVSDNHARIRRTGEGAFYVEDLGSEHGTFVGERRVGLWLLEQGDEVRLGRALGLRFDADQPLQPRPTLRPLAPTHDDVLTGLFSRSYVIERAEHEVDACQRSGAPLSILMVALDLLADLNHAFGHFVGDRALCVVAAEIRKAVRAEHVVGRYSGGVFVVVAPGASAADGAQLAERVRGLVEAIRVGARGQTLRLTVSIGLACLSDLAPGMDAIDPLFAFAHERLASAKAAGRNRVLGG